MDHFDYFSLSIESQKGLFVTYANGQLPLQEQSGDYYEIGWKFNF